VFYRSSKRPASFGTHRTTQAGRSDRPLAAGQGNTIGENYATFGDCGDIVTGRIEEDAIQSAESA